MAFIAQEVGGNGAHCIGTCQVSRSLGRRNGNGSCPSHPHFTRDVAIMMVSAQFVHHAGNVEWFGSAAIMEASLNHQHSNRAVAPVEGGR